MDSEIQFGEMEQSEPVERPRPDQDPRLVVEAVYSPTAEDLPIYVDLDVLREMIRHAESDSSVELGGVLLGGQFADERGVPFVMITDCLRARHFESTKGSFKFTHDTWQQITRDREELAPELQMVGWYHTHPDWGIFLSGLDLFICDHFFNKPLDVAFVIDPCQMDTGFFQWTNSSGQRIRRTGGYLAFTSRLRAEELREFVGALEEYVMPESSRTAKNSPLHVQLPPPPPPPVWQTLAVLGMLGMQFCLLVVLAIRLLPNSTTTPFAAGQLSGNSSVAALSDGLKAREAAIDAKLEVLDTVLRHEGDLPEGVLKTLADRTEEVESLRNSLRGQRSLSKELDTKVAELEKKLQEVERRDEDSRIQLTSLQSKLKELSRELASGKTQSPAKNDAADDDARSWWSRWLADGRSLGFGAFLGASAVAAAGYVLLRRNSSGHSTNSDATTDNDSDDQDL